MGSEWPKKIKVLDDNTLRWQPSEAFESFYKPPIGEQLLPQDRIVADRCYKRKTLPPVPLEIQLRPDELVTETVNQPPEAAAVDTWARILPVGGGVIQHNRTCSSRERPDEAFGQHLMTEGEHRITFVTVRGTGTGMKVGVASDDGSKTWGFRLFDGRLCQFPNPPPAQGSSKWMQTHKIGDEHLHWSLPNSMGGDGLSLKLTHTRFWDRMPGQRIEIIVNMAERSLVFNAGGASPVPITVGSNLT